MDNIIKEAVKELEAKLSGSVCEIIKTKIDEADSLRKKLNEYEDHCNHLIEQKEDLFSKLSESQKSNKELRVENARLSEKNNYFKTREKDLEIRETTIQEQILQSRVMDQEQRIQDMKYLIEVAFKAGKHNDQTANQDTDL